MKKVSVYFENCYGIKKLEHEFDFSKNPCCLIYASNTLESMCEQDLMEEAFCVLHTIIKTSGIRLPDEYKCIVDNEILHSDFIEEAVADLEDMLYDLE